MSVLQPPRADILPYFEKLVPEYRTYCTTTSRRAMALSIETCAYVWWLCEFKQARVVADLGSGFSSYMLRRYAAEADHEVVVHSVDSDPWWLQKSATFSEVHGMSTDGFVTGDEWLRYRASYDVVLNDYDKGRVREAFAEHGVDRLGPAGVIVFDDAQNREHHHHMANLCREKGFTLLDVYHQTVDEIGRFASAGARL